MKGRVGSRMPICGTVGAVDSRLRENDGGRLLAAYWGATWPIVRAVGPRLREDDEGRPLAAY